ncbi:MAG: hypothetical protein ACI9UR_000536 [Bacteroidia bacterium]|jgi:hypothetical protein
MLKDTYVRNYLEFIKVLVHHMKTLLTVLAFVSFQAICFGQCSTVSVQISSSDTSLIQLYNAGQHNIPSGFANVCEWEVTTFQGAIVHQDTTSGPWADQSFSLFTHSAPTTDSMEVTLFITNAVEGITCSITDTLFWEETEVIPGVFIGNWALLGDYGGTENELVTSIPIYQAGIEMVIFPNPTSGQVQLSVEDVDGVVSYTIYDALGKEIASESFVANGKTQKNINLSDSDIGFYTLQLITSKGSFTEKLIKE